MKNHNVYFSVLLGLCFLLILLTVSSGVLLAQEETAEEYSSEIPPTPEGQKIPVNIGVAVIDVDTIDGSNQSFVANFSVSAQWEDPRLATDTDVVRIMNLNKVWSPTLQILNQQKLFKTFPDKAEVSPDGTVTYRQRYWGTLSNAMNLKTFPLDNHNLQIKIISIGNNANDIQFSISDERTGMAEQLTVTDWNVKGWDAYAANIDLGRTLPTPPGVVFELQVQRLVGFYIIKVLIPLMLIVFMSLVVLFIDPAQMGPRFSISITAILTLIAYRFLLGNLLPKISYLTYMDYFLFGSM
ncbi:MAG: hypothetical protein GTO02_19835, partial [Candidatus Dadabacteria bacterium]|nr:hypothetical protein [Candidatus Dadabacteria bacterium]NIQ16552.1 hypothetical protein [Candidatus Dadabacteria bacterium]